MGVVWPSKWSNFKRAVAESRGLTGECFEMTYVSGTDVPPLTTGTFVIEVLVTDFEIVKDNSCCIVVEVARPPVVVCVRSSNVLDF